MCIRGSALSLYLVQLLIPVDEKFYTHLWRNGAKSIEKTLATVNATLDSNCVIEVLHRCQPNQSQMGLRFFIWAGLQSKYRHGSFMYGKACELLQINQNLGGVVDIVEVYKVDGYVVSAKAFKVVLNLCKEARLANEALWILGIMNEFGLEADTTAYNVVIRRGSMKRALELLGEMEKEVGNCSPNVVTYTSVTQTFVRKVRQWRHWKFWIEWRLLGVLLITLQHFDKGALFGGMSARCWALSTKPFGRGCKACESSKSPVETKQVGEFKAYVIILGRYERPCLVSSGCGMWNINVSGGTVAVINQCLIQLKETVLESKALFYNAFTV
uniref:Pentatricopeptide repeat-containing protein n=1 Tax=Quercus lobata TaxID=97700 RepID=A0A7N2KNU4_QUELO